MLSDDEVQMLKLNEKKKMGWTGMGCYWIGGLDWIFLQKTGQCAQGAPKIAWLREDLPMRLPSWP